MIGDPDCALLFEVPIKCWSGLESKQSQQPFETLVARAIKPAEQVRKRFRWSSHQLKRRNRDYTYLLILGSFLIERISYYCYDVKWNEKTILCLLRDSTSSWQVRVQIAYLSRSTPFFFECFVFRFRRSSSTHSNDDVTSLRRASRWRIRSIHEPLPTSEVCPGWSLP